MSRTIIAHPARVTVVQSHDVYLTEADSPTFTYEAQTAGYSAPKTHTVRISRVHVQFITEGDDEPVRTADAYVRNQLANGSFSNGEKLLPPRNVTDEMSVFLNMCIEAVVHNGEA